MNIRFSDWARQWQEDAKRRVELSNYEGYEIITRNHIVPYFDAQGTMLADVTRPVLQEFIDYVYAHGRKDNKSGPLAPKTMRHVRNVLHMVLKAAVEDGMLPVNPCEGLIIPQSQRYDYQFYNGDELARMFTALQQEVLFPLIFFTAVYGLRRSEVLGLKWDSVDFAANSLTIKHTVVKMKTSVLKDKTKTKSSYRTFPLLPDVRELLLEAKEREQECRRLFGRDYVENPYIFKWDNGIPFAPDFVSQKFPDLLKKHGLRRIRFHDLRHSCASYLLANGYNLKDAQEWLGHSDIATTANVYAHLDLGRKREIANGFMGKFSPGMQV